MQRTVLEEDILDQALADFGIHQLTSTHKIVQGQVVLQYYQGPHPLLTHIQAGHDDWEDGFAFVNKLREIFLLVGAEEVDEAMNSLSRSHTEEEMTNLLLKQNNDGYGTDIYQLIQNAAHQLHLKNLADNDPETDKEQHSVKDIHRARLLHDLITIVQAYRYKQDINQVLYSEF